MINITLAGMLFSIYTLQKQSIAWAVGIHFSWNFTQGVILGYKVSGSEVTGALLATPKGADYLSGGDFGVEGSIWCTALLVIWIAWQLYKGGQGFIEIRDPQVMINEGYELEND